MVQKNLPLIVVARDYNEVRVFRDNTGSLEADAVDGCPGDQDYRVHEIYGLITLLCIPFLPLISPAKTVATSSAVVSNPKVGRLMFAWAVGIECGDNSLIIWCI